MKKCWRGRRDEETFHFIVAFVSESTYALLLNSKGEHGTAQSAVQKTNRLQPSSSWSQTTLNHVQQTQTHRMRYLCCNQAPVPGSVVLL